MFNIENLGQIFTPIDVVSRMITLIQNGNRILEPSSGLGAFYDELAKNYTNIVSIELDEKICRSSFLNIDFFEYSINEKFDTIIGNPPYVMGKNIKAQTKTLLNSELITHQKSNLFLYFIEKCIHHLTDNGEIIFISPREWIKSTSAINLNKYIYTLGTITHWFEIGDVKIFKECSPNVAIWRFQKNNFTQKTITNYGLKNFIISDGQLFFLDNDLLGNKIGDLFTVKVGGVSGLDEVFTHTDGNLDFVCSYTNKTGKLKRMFYDVEHQHLLNNKERLLNRKIKKFNDDNYWLWGRDFYKSEKNRIYVNLKTRQKNPFFINSCKNYDGSVMALIPKNLEIENNLSKYLSILNNINWEELGFKIGGRFIFTQRTLENTIIKI